MFKTWWLFVIFAIFSMNQYFRTCASEHAQVTVQSRVRRPPWPYLPLCKDLSLSALLHFHLQTDDVLVREASHYQDWGKGGKLAYFESLKLWSRPPFPRRLNSAQWPKKTSFKPKKYQGSKDRSHHRTKCRPCWTSLPQRLRQRLLKKSLCCRWLVAAMCETALQK